jgi:diguanylate cyclase
VESWNNASHIAPEEPEHEAHGTSGADAAPAAPAHPSGAPTPEHDATRSRRVPLPITDPLVQRMRTLLQLLLQNISELTPEAALLSLQVEVVSRVLVDPLTDQKLDEAERILRTLIIRQGTIKHGMEEAKFAAKELVSSLVDRLSTLSATAGNYSGKIHDVAERIAKAENLTQLSQLVTTLLSDTRLMSSDMLRARDDLDAARAKTRLLEERTLSLEAELARASALVRIDPLTEALNRRGFEEVYGQELARTNRSSTPARLCVAILDVDNFKRINDSFGHIAGDDALRHLIAVVREITRPNDAVGRYGGEEFVVLFPDTPVDEAVNVMTRVQRELTRRVFLQENSRILITFSCGVTAIGAGEELELVLSRADRALQQAKTSGKNRVVVGGA